ncbi:MAG: helix-turn-helix transcriptional regulator [Candidatus Gastranaerophilales bacterium]|nr:helix-turn-helix transcriptional regulator [Candidatus Gastranaerophilales bacterium]
MKNKTISELSNNICLKIKLERIKRNISQEELALMAGLNRNTIGKIERMETSPSIDTIEKIAKVFEMNFLELVDVSKIDLQKS